MKSAWDGILFDDCLMVSVLAKDSTPVGALWERARGSLINLLCLNLPTSRVAIALADLRSPLEFAVRRYDGLPTNNRPESAL